MRPRLALAVALGLLAGPAWAGELLYVSEGNRLRRYDIDTLGRGRTALEEIVFENAATDPEHGRDINGMVCPLPDGSGRFIAGEDTSQPHPRAGWGLLSPRGVQLGKLTPTARAEIPDPHGCAFDPAGRLFGTERGGSFLGGDGQLVLWFGPFDRFPGEPGRYPQTDATSTQFCKIATDLSTPTGVAVDREGRVYVATASGGEVLRFSPPFPTAPDAAGGCGGRDEVGSPQADRVQVERFLGPRLRDGLLTYSGLAFARNGNLYVASVATGRIAEIDPQGELVRMLVEPSGWLPPYDTGTPMGLAVDSQGTLYYADLDLRPGLRRGLDPGPDGKVWRIRFRPNGSPLPPEPVAHGLAFPDGLGVLPGDLEKGRAR